MTVRPDDTRGEKQNKLKKIIKDLHAGVPADRLKKEFAKLIKNTSPDEIADMENALIQEGFPSEEIQRLCDVHAQVFEQSLKKAGKPGKIPGHPIYTYVQENKEAKLLLKQMLKSAKKLRKGSPGDKEIQIFKRHFDRFQEIEKHYQRKENQLFPLLEEKKFTGPTQVMWGKHDEIRGMIKRIKQLIEDRAWRDIHIHVSRLSSAVRKLIFLEEKILYPTSSKKLSIREWAEMKMGEPEIGYAWVTPSNLWDARLAETMRRENNKNNERKRKMTDKPNDKVKLSQGQLTTEQIDLLLKNLPVDITFVDENDEVRYYSDTKDRIFPRSPAIIGRAVQNCHPPKSVHIVNDIVDKFKKKQKNLAEFWIQMEGKFIHIRYFPLFDEKGTYRGVIEVSQEVSHIKKLEGERRLLDW